MTVIYQQPQLLVDSNPHIKEFKPLFLNKDVISEELCKASFEIYKGKTVEILFNPSRNMFNATKLYNYSIQQKSLNNDTETKDEFTSPDRDQLNNAQDSSDLNTNYYTCHSIKNIPNVVMICV